MRISGNIRLHLDHGANYGMLLTSRVFFFFPAIVPQGAVHAEFVCSADRSAAVTSRSRFGLSRMRTVRKAGPRNSCLAGAVVPYSSLLVRFRSRSGCGVFRSGCGCLRPFAGLFGRTASSSSMLRQPRIRASGVRTSWLDPGDPLGAGMIPPGQLFVSRLAAALWSGSDFWQFPAKPSVGAVRSASAAHPGPANATVSSVGPYASLTQNKQIVRSNSSKTPAEWFWQGSGITPAKV